MKSRLLILQEGGWRDPGGFLRRLAGHCSIEVHLLESWQEELSDYSAFDALLVAGGPTVDPLDTLSPALKKQFIEPWLVLDKPFLGFGSGYQLLADAFQAGVEPGGPGSVRFLEVFLTHDGRAHPLFRGIGPNISFFTCYNQSMQTPVPQNCLLLATSKTCVVEAFTIKGRPHLIGMRCDMHAAHPDDLRKWMAGDVGCSPESACGRMLLRRAQQSRKENEKLFCKLLANFMSQVKR